MITDCKKNKKKRVNQILNIITDIIMLPLLCLLLFFTINSLIDRKNYKPPSIFGYSIVQILSESMVDSGFNIKDTVIIKKTKTDDLKYNDIIAFYVSTDIYERLLPATVIDVTENPEDYVSVEPTSKAITGKIIYFHHIVEIKYDQEGVKWFKTKGSSNDKEDSFWVKSNYIIGRYHPTSKGLNNFLSFMVSNKAIGWLAIIPSGILFMLNAFSFIGIIEQLLIEKDIMEKKKSLDCDESIEKDVPLKIQNKNKVILLRDCLIEQREYYFKLLFGFEFKDLDKQSTRIQRNIIKYNIDKIMNSQIS